MTKSAVYQCINAVQADLSKVGISKDQKNSQQGYKFRGIDDVYNALAPALAKNGLCILPKVLERTITEKVTKSGSALFYVVVRMEFHFVASEDGSTHVVSTYGEAMDSGDKATNKAMSAAYKYACMQAFCIPTEGDNDADAQTHEVKANAPVQQTQQPVQQVQVDTKPICTQTLTRLCAVIVEHDIKQETIDKWFKKLGVDQLNKLTENNAQSILSHYKKIEEERRHQEQEQQRQWENAS